jgi:transcriptional regulator GlxA family with amidase domain
VEHPVTRKVGIFVYDQVEALDLAGPYEVFTTAARMSDRLAPGREPPFEVHLISREHGPVSTRAGMRVLPDQDLDRSIQVDVLLIPGGVIDHQLELGDVVAWVGAAAQSAEIVASVCTGAFLLAKAGLLNGFRATTHWEDLSSFGSMFPQVQVVADKRWVDEGRIITSAGISAGIDMSLHLVSRLTGRELAVRTARQMDYRWQDEA